MISHKHKCIFIHISKCAGSSIETAFGIDISDNSEKNNKHLFGWNEKLKMHLQHATPNNLLENGLINLEIWNSYYKFIVIRNPYDRAYSDYFWLRKEQFINDSFSNYLNGKGKFEKVLSEKNILYRGDHLYPQKEYFFYNGKIIDYDSVIYFEEIKKGLNKVCSDLSLPSTFFDRKINMGKRKKHYSFFYNKKRIKLVEELYNDDLEFFDYSFKDKKRGLKDYIYSNLSFKFSTV